MISCWIPHLLAQEVSTATRQAQGASRSSAADLRDEPGKSFLGLSGHVGNRSLADIDAELEEFSMDASMPPGAFFRCQSSADCITIMSGSDVRHGQQTAGPELVDVSAQSYTRDRGDGPFRRADACLQPALWLHHRSARPPRARLDWRDEQSDGRMDCTPDHRGFPWESAPGYLIRDRDRVFGSIIRQRLRAMGIRDKPIAPRAPWQNGFAERLIGSIRRKCLDHIIVFGEAHLRRLLCAYADYYNGTRTHRSLDKDAPLHRPTQRIGLLRSHPILGGLHHHYVRI